MKTDNLINQKINQCFFQCKYLDIQLKRKYSTEPVFSVKTWKKRFGLKINQSLIATLYIPATCQKGRRAVGLARYWGMKLLKAARCSFSCRTHGGPNMNKIVGNKLFHRQRGRLNNRVLRREQHSHMIFTLFSQHSFVRFCVKLFFSAIGANSCLCVFYTGTSYFPLYCSVCLLDFIGFDNFF